MKKIINKNMIDVNGFEELTMKEADDINGGVITGIGVTAMGGGSIGWGITAFEGGKVIAGLGLFS